MYLKHFQLKQDPFSAHPDSHIFFPGGGREIVLQHVLENLSSGMTLVHLSGEKGSGKTLMCQLIRTNQRSSQTIILLSPPSGPFDDKSSSFTLAFGENDAKHLEEDKLYEEILCLISDSGANTDDAGSTVLIIDDAENLSPTILTRILHLAYDDLPKRDVQFVLAGRLPLGANPAQFTTIRAESLQQVTYTLQPLDRDDTASYLAFRLSAAGIAEDKLDSVFSTEAIARIYETTCGNIFLINILAEEALRNAFNAKSFIVLLDHVKGPSDFTAALPISISRPSEPHRTPRKIIAGIIVLTIIASVWVYNMLLVDNDLKQRIAEPLVMTQEIPPSLVENLPASSLAQNVPPPLPVVTPEVEKSVSSPAPSAPPPPPVVVPEVDNHSKILTIKPLKVEKKGIVVLTLDKTLKVQHKAKKQIDLPEKIQTNVNLDGRLTSRELYHKRIIAGDLWIKGERNGLYTLQLMALKASNAETNMKQMLNQKRYRQHASNLYIFRKKTAPETVFVFYGEYKNLTTARLAQRSIPGFLKAHRPYAISVKEAMAKLGK